MTSRRLAQTQNRDAGDRGERASLHGVKIHTASNRSLRFSARFSLQYGGVNTGSVQWPVVILFARLAMVAGVRPALSGTLRRTRAFSARSGKIFFIYGYRAVVWVCLHCTMLVCHLGFIYALSLLLNCTHNYNECNCCLVLPFELVC